MMVKRRFIAVAVGWLVLSANISCAGTSLLCVTVGVASTKTVVLPKNLSRKSLLLQGVSPINIWCADGDVQEPGLPGPGGVGVTGFVVTHMESPDPYWGNNSKVVYSIAWTGEGTPTGPIVCVHRTAGALRKVIVCEGTESN